MLQANLGLEPVLGGLHDGEHRRHADVFLRCFVQDGCQLIDVRVGQTPGVAQLEPRRLLRVTGRVLKQKVTAA